MVCAVKRSAYELVFSCNTGVKQGDRLSSTLYSIFINDLVQDNIELALGVDIGKMKLSLLQCTLCGRHSNASEIQSGPSTGAR